MTSVALILSLNQPFRLKQGGAAKVYAVCTHGIFSGPALSRLNSSEFACITATNSMPQEKNMLSCDRLQVLFSCGVERARPEWCIILKC